MHRTLMRLPVWSVALMVCLAVSMIGCVAPRDRVVRAAGSGSVSWVPLYGADTTALAIEPATSGVLYAADSGALYRTTDGALSWQRLAGVPEGTSFNSIIVAPGSPGAVYVVAGTGGILCSTDRGATWNARNTGIPGLGSGSGSGVMTLALDPKKPSILYAGTEKGIFRTVDSGAHWSLLKATADMSYVFGIVVDPVTPETIYANTNGRGLCRSTDSGAHWTTLAKGPRGGTLAGLAIDPLKHATLYAATAGGGTGVMKSLNSGTSWASVNSGLTTKDIQAVAVDQHREGTVYALGSNGDFFRSTNAGASWKRTMSFPLQKVHTLVADPNKTGVLYVCTSGGVFRSVDAGTSWVSAVMGMAGTGVTAVAMDTLQPSTLYAATGGGVFRSTDGGLDWTSISKGLTGSAVATLAVDPFVHTTLYAGTDDGFFRSTDSGASWKNCSAGLQTVSVLCCAPDAWHEGVVYIGTDAGRVLSGTVYRSADRGTTWTMMDDGLGTERKYVSSLVLDSGNGGVLYAGGNAGLWRKAEDEHSWTQIGAGLSGTSTLAMAVDQGTGALFISKGSATMTPGGVYTSTDGGEHWMACPIAPPGEDPFFYDTQALAVAPGSPATVLAATLVRGVFCSTDGGSTWTSLARELDDLGGRVLRPDPLAPGTGIIGTLLGGLFRYDLSGTAIGTMQLVIGANTLCAGRATIPLEAAPVILHDRTMLPIRALVEQAGGTADWDASTQTVTISWKGRTVVLSIGSGTALVDGLATPVDADSSVVPVIQNGRTLLPVRFIAESLGWTVFWNNTARMVTLQYPLT